MRFSRKKPALFKLCQWHFHQDNRAIDPSTTPSLSQTFWPRWTSRQFLALPVVQTLLPVTFSHFMRQLRRWKRLWRRSLTRSHKRSSMGPSRGCWNGKTSALLREEITSKGTRVSCEYYQWKCACDKSLETYLMILIDTTAIFHPVNNAKFISLPMYLNIHIH